MYQTITAIERDGLEFRTLSITFKVPATDFDLMHELKLAVADFCNTQEGRAVLDYNCGCFNLADVEMSLPNEFCKRRGFQKLESVISDIEIDWDTSLIDADDLRDLDEESPKKPEPAFLATDIVWDIDDEDDEDCDFLPDEVRVPVSELLHDQENYEDLDDDTLLDRVVDYLSDEYEYCVLALSIAKEGADAPEAPAENSNMHYFEVWLQETDEPGGMYDRDICIRGLREPSIEEAEAFLRVDRGNDPEHVLHVYRVIELDRAEAEDSFDFSNESEWPVFGA